jgi:hypothetical protein
VTDQDACRLVERAVARARAHRSRPALALAGAAVEAWRLAEEAPGQDGHDRLLGRSEELAAETLATLGEAAGDGADSRASGPGEPGARA